MNYKRNVAALLLICSCSYSAFAEIASRAPDAREWVTSLKQSDIENIVAPMSLTFVDSLGDNGSTTGTPIFKKFDHKTCRQISYLTCTAQRDASYSILLNGKNLGGGIAAIFAVTPGNSAVVAAGDKVVLYSRQSSAPIDLEIKKADFVKLNVRAVVDKILTALGYDAVVLAAKEDYLLVGSTETRLNHPSIQGLIVASSSDKWSLVDVNSKGAGLLSLVSRFGGFGVFQLVLPGDSVGSTVPLGTKVIIETAK